MTVVTLGSQISRVVGRQRVFFSTRWANFAERWEEYPDAHCLEATWCLSPSMPTATIQWPYGWIQREGEIIYDERPKLDCIDWFAKVVMPLHSDAQVYRNWYGVVGHVEDRHHGIVTVNGKPLATGVQTIHCYGLEKLLDTEVIADSWIDVGEAAAIPVQLPVAFNARGEPNRNDGLVAPEFQYVFEGRSINPGGTLRPTAQWWSTTDIVNYLLAWAVPRDSFRTRFKRIVWRIDDSRGLLPTKDRPTLHQEGQTVLALLNRLIDRRRLRSFYVTLDEETEQVVVTPVAWNAEVIDPGIDDVDPLAANTREIFLNYDHSQCVAGIVRKTKVSRYDRVIARGARRTSTATFFFDDACLVADWTDEEEAAYEAGASGEAGYADLDWLEQIERNNEVRQREELNPVYAWFKLPDWWDGTVDGADIFVDEAGDLVRQYIHEVAFENQLALYERVDYSTVADAQEPPIKAFRRPLVVFEVPDSERWVKGDGIRALGESSADPVEDGDNFRWSAICRPVSSALSVESTLRTVEVRASGEPQYVIAHSDFTPLDEDRALGEFDYREKKMLLTLTLRDNRCCEGKYPDDGFGDATFVDAQYGYVIHAGDEYRQDYLVPGTVVDVDTDGTLIATDGGYVRDDTDKLNLLARIAYEWWSQERMIITLTTTDLSPALDIGVLIGTVGDSVMPDNEHYETVNTVISELRIEWPILKDRDLEVPVMTIVTGAGELDPMTLLPPLDPRPAKMRGRR